MKKFRLTVEVTPLEEGGFLAIAPGLRGCLAEGASIAEALENIEDVARVLIELSIEKGLPLPPELQGEEPPTVISEMVIKVPA